MVGKNMIPEPYSSREYFDVNPATDSGVNRQMILIQNQPIFIRQTRGLTKKSRG